MTFVALLFAQLSTISFHRHFRMLVRVKRKKLGKPLMEPQLGKEPDEVEVLEDLDRVFGGDGGEGGGCMAV